MADFEYQLDCELIVVPVTVTGKTGIYDGMFVLDTGASGIMLDHSIALDIGYSAHDGVGFSTVSSVVGKESGYRLIIGEFEALGYKAKSVEVRCHDLKEQGVEGLIGMTFLKQFKWCVDPQKQIISVK